MDHRLPKKTERIIYPYIYDVSVSILVQDAPEPSAVPVLAICWVAVCLLQHDPVAMSDATGKLIIKWVSGTVSLLPVISRSRMNQVLNISNQRP